MAEEKPVKCIILDAGPLILNDPSISSLLAKSDELVTTNAVVSEIRDPAARARLETTVQPFLKIRNPAPTSIKVVSDFARRTGDLAVLSKTDLQILALAYEIECERNGGDWRLRRAPGQKTLNGPPPAQAAQPTDEEAAATTQQGTDHQADGAVVYSNNNTSAEKTADAEVSHIQPVEQTTAALENVSLAEKGAQVATIEPQPQSNQDGEEEEDDDSGGEWITPSNLAARKARDEAGPDTQDVGADQAVMEVATITTDYAMQNVLLQMNLNLLSTALRRVKHAKSHILRCHACFSTTKDMNKQFCPRCGKPTLTRVACSTKANGTFVLHLKKNFQYNKRGDRYSIPKPVAGSANGRVQGGGKNSWGNDLILAEDQKEYTRSSRDYNKTKQKNLMDDDYLPSILTGDRGGSAGGKPKVGAGRNVNSRKR